MASVTCPSCQAVVEEAPPALESQGHFPCPQCGETISGRAGAAPNGRAASTPTPQTTAFGPFELLGRLGTGGMGTVFRARHKGLDHVVALKVMRSRLADETARKRFEREARISASVDHPNIVKVLDAGEVGERAFIAMEYVEGVPFDKYTRTHDLSVEAIVEVVRKTALAVHAAHEAQVIHRDIKPGNILVREDGEPMLADFGLAKSSEDSMSLTASGNVVGTAIYMSPEQITSAEARAGVDHRSDVYSLGVVLYEALTGYLPFGGQSTLEVLCHIVKEDPVAPGELNPDVPGALELICLKAIAKDREERYSSARELADDLQRCLDGQTVEAKAPRLLQTAWRRDGRLTAMAWVAILGFIVTGLVTIGCVGYVFAAMNAARAAEREKARLQTELAELEAERREAGSPARATAPAETVQESTGSAPQPKPSKPAAALEPVASEPPAVLEAPPAPDEPQEVPVAPTAGPSAAEPKPRALPYQATGRLPARLERAFMLPDLSLDQHGNSVTVRNTPGVIPGWAANPSRPDESQEASSSYRDVDHRTGWAVEIWLKQPRLEFVLIPSGQFPMGAPPVEQGRVDREGPVRTVRVSKPFYLSKYEITCAQWQDVMGSMPRRTKPASPSQAVNHVSWEDCQKLLKAFRAQGVRFSLPSEAQWEYACRAGSRTRFCHGDDLDHGQLGRYGWYIESMDRADGSAGLGPRPVGQKKPNAWGLHDMHGNVWEWCGDVWHSSYEGAPTDDSPWRSEEGVSNRVCRGGAFINAASFCRSAFRFRYSARLPYPTIGVRLCLREF